MVVCSSSSPTPISRRNKSSSRAIGAGGIFNLPVIDLSMEDKCVLSEKIVEACEEFGFFKVVNHGVSEETIGRMEEEGGNFFAKTAAEKQKAAAGPATTTTPYGYGSKNIGFNGDKGELEYLLLQTQPCSVSHSNHLPITFSCAVNDYIGSVEQLACDILDLVAQGLCVSDKSVFSRLLKDSRTDSCFRLNHYPPATCSSTTTDTRVGFGEHSDPQILTVLRSNTVGGLQIYVPVVDDQEQEQGFWVPVPPDPTHFCVFVGDTLQAMTNGRFTSARHRVVVTNHCCSSKSSRMSMMYFGAPSLNAYISPLPETVSPPDRPSQYRPFTWSEFKKAAYSMRLGDSRLNLFKKLPHDHHGDDQNQPSLFAPSS